MWFHDRADFLLVPTSEVYHQALEYGFQAERVQITGIPVHPNFSRENRPSSSIRAELGWQIELTTVLVVGSKRVKNLEQVLHILNHSLRMQLVVWLAVTTGSFLY
jgi:UDP-N-acetylglucosamine:LPS N-acetylglucosamine transferase